MDQLADAKQAFSTNGYFATVQGKEYEQKMPIDDAFGGAASGATKSTL